MRNKFEEQLMHLNNELITMGALCEEAISGCVKYLFNSDSEMKEAVIEVEKQIDQKERDIEQLCMKLLIQQQPVATDFRIISSALKMISDMERIGDQASDIAEISQYLRGDQLKNRVPLQDMAVAVTKMVTESVDSFVHRDLKLAEEVIEYDDVADSLFLDIKGGLVRMISADSSCGEAALDLLMIAKYLERIGDHATNIAEWVGYAVTGEYKGGEL